MRRLLVLLLSGAAVFGITATLAAYNGGFGDGDMPTSSGGCANAIGCHGSQSTNGTVDLEAVADDGTWDTPGEQGTVTATVNLDAANSNDDIAGVAILDSDLQDNIKVSGWVISQDPNSSPTPYNYNEMMSPSGNIDFSWTVNAPDSAGVFRLVARLLFDDSGARRNESEIVEVVLITGVAGEHLRDVPASVRTIRNHPSPFRESTTISYVLPISDNAVLTVYDATGRLVRTLVDGQVSAGEHSVSWTGMDDRGEELPAGLYFFKLVSGRKASVGKTVLVR